MVEHNAVVVMEDLNFGFKRGRFKIEKQVYQSFESQLIEKLNYLVTSKDQSDALRPGGVLQGYQLSKPFVSFEKLGKQSGAIYYVPAWNTSHIDPLTGFVNLFTSKYLTYASKEKTVQFFTAFDGIRFNPSAGYFEFKFDYRSFELNQKSPKSQWTVCSHTVADRIVHAPTVENGITRHAFRPLDVNAELKALFEDAQIEYASGQDLRAQIQGLGVEACRSLLWLFNQLVKLRYSSDTEDYILSPVADEQGRFFYSSGHEFVDSGDYPTCGDANGAYNIALKGLQLAQEQIQPSSKGVLDILPATNEDWLRWIQTKPYRAGLS